MFDRFLKTVPSVGRLAVSPHNSDFCDVTGPDAGQCYVQYYSRFLGKEKKERFIYLIIYFNIMATDWIITSILALIISVPLSALLLMFSAKIFKLQDTSYKTAIKILAIIGVIGFILDAIIFTFLPTMVIVLAMIQFIILNIILAIIFIKQFYNLEWKQTLLVWLVWFLFSLVLMVVVGIIVGIIGLALGFASAMAAA